MLLGLTGCAEVRDETGIEARALRINGVVLEDELGTPDRPVEVARQSSVSGQASEIPSDQYLWIVLHPEASLYWPQLGQVLVNPRTGDWTHTFYADPEGGDYGKRFDVILLLCNREAHDHFLAWQQEGDRTGRYPGINIPDGTKVLDIVTVRKTLDKVRKEQGSQLPDASVVVPP